MAGRAWREAASLILVARTGGVSKTSPSNSRCFDYNVLMLKRSSRSKFMPNAFVFPGGVTDLADFSNEWDDIFRPFGGPGQVVLSSSQEGVSRPNMFGQRSDNVIDCDVAFRINAIRETFEESGVLLHKGSKDPDDRIMDQWRQAVHKDPSQFVEMCRQLEICPDIWSLYEWSDWLTPVHLKGKGKARFDTLFYVAFRDDEYHDDTASHDDKEVTEVNWTNPDQLFEDYRGEKLWLAPPQVYELSRMARHTQFDELKRFAAQRAEKGIATWMPVLMKCADGIISIYPGDELYPQEPDYQGNRDEMLQTEVTMKELSGKHERRNRMEMKGLYYSRVDCTIVDPHGHEMPIE